MEVWPGLVDWPATAICPYFAPRVRGGVRHRFKLGEKVVEKNAQPLGVVDRPRSGERHPYVRPRARRLVHGGTAGRDDPPVVGVAAPREIHEVIAIGARRHDRGEELFAVHVRPRWSRIAPITQTTKTSAPR